MYNIFKVVWVVLGFFWIGAWASTGGVFPFLWIPVCFAQAWFIGTGIPYAWSTSALCTLITVEHGYKLWVGTAASATMSWIFLIIGAVFLIGTLTFIYYHS